MAALALNPAIWLPKPVFRALMPEVVAVLAAPAQAVGLPIMDPYTFGGVQPGVDARAALTGGCGAAHPVDPPYSLVT